jgi:hypothetical protein
MKFVVFFEWDPKNLDKIFEKGLEWVKEQKDHPDKYAKYMRLQDGTGIGFGMIGRAKGFTLREVDTEEQMYNASRWWNPLLKLTYIPIRQTQGAKAI